MSVEGWPSIPQAGIIARVVPAGLEDRGNGKWGLVTLSLMPWIPPEGASIANPIPLSEWPLAVEKLLAAGNKLYLNAIRPGDAAVAVPKISGKGITVYRSAKSFGEAEATRARGLWQRLIGEGPLAWTALAGALRESQSGASLDQLHCGPLPGTGGTGTAGVQADATATAARRPDVFAYPRGDAALLYGFERAREVLNVMQGKVHAVRVGTVAIGTGGRHLNEAALTFDRKPWLGIDAMSIRVADAATSDAQVTTSSLQGFPARNKALAEERAAQEAKYRETLEGKAKQAQAQAARRVDYLAATDAATRVALLKAHAAERATSVPPSACLDACGPGAHPDASQDLADRVKAVHSLGSLPDVDAFGDVVSTPPDMLDDAFQEAIEAARHRFYAITGMPSLARLLNFVIDVEFKLDDFLTEIGQSEASAAFSGFREWGVIDHFADQTGADPIEAPSEAGAPAHYFHLTSTLGHPVADDGKGGAAPRLWTLAKFRPFRGGKAGEAGHFWPCTQEEVDLRLEAAARKDDRGGDIRGSCAVSQFDGVLDLGLAFDQPDGVVNPRYDIASLDMIQAVESDINSDRRLKGWADAADGGSGSTSELGAQTRRTAGLAVLDRWRQDQVVSQIVTAKESRDAKTVADVVLDAEQLAAGYRLDVGVLPASPPGRRRVWRGLMNRTMAFGTGRDDEAWIEPTIEALYRWPDVPRDKGVWKERRQRADSASLSVASRVRDNGSEREDRAAKTVFAEEIMIAWQGDPLGVDCLNPHGSAEVHPEKDGFWMHADGLPLELRYGLESEDRAYLPPPLRYGWPYHFGLRPVYLGGVVLPLELAISRYERNFLDGAALPSPNAQGGGGRRFLRHERLEAPILTVPAALAARLDASQADRDDPRFDRAGVDTGATCLLRTSLRSSNATVYPNSTLRILVPPVVPLHQAALHGVFDHDRVETVVLHRSSRDGAPLEPVKLVRPVDGLKAIDFSGDMDPDTRDLRGGFPHHRAAARSPGDAPNGPAVFRLGPGLGARSVPFYPDPAADCYVVAVRRPSSADYLCGTIVIPVRTPSMTYPDVLPLALEVRKLTSARREPAKRIDQLVAGNPQGLGHIGSDGMVSHGGGLAARHLALEIGEGEDFEVEVWCAPSEADLYRAFDIVESLAALLAREGAAAGSAIPADEVCMASLKRYFPFMDDPGSALGLAKPTDAPLCGPGGQSLPTPAVLRYLARALALGMRRAPVPELAAVARLRATHAVDLPLRPPSFPGQARIGRLRPDTMRALLADAAEPVAAKRRAERLRAKGACWEQMSDDGATNAIVDGCIAVDLLTTADVEIRASMPSPTSAAFDDVKRGRSAEERARGVYLRPGTVSDLTKATPWPAMPTVLSEDDCRRLFGFTVDQNGRVALPRRAAPLAFVRDLPETPLKARMTWSRTFDLLEQQRNAYAADAKARAPSSTGEGQDRNGAVIDEGSADPAARACRVQYVQPFHDGLARRLELTLVATSRYANLFPRSAEESEVGAMSGAPVPAGEGSEVDRKRTHSEARSVWLPATRRPDRLPARSLRPSFIWNFGKAEVPSALPGAPGLRRVATATRTCSIHLPFARPHFTSGEGERVGIVVWPPDLLLGAEASDIGQDRVRRSEQPSGFIKLDDKFSDSDLGPGGSYVTRWGADPIREGPRPEGWLIPASAFSDAGPQADGSVEYVPNVLMPIPRKEHDPDKEVDAEAREFMLVSLLTYEPRFDIDYEHWYIDVTIDAGVLPEPFIRIGLVRYQEHARRELQVSEPIAPWVQVMPKRMVCVDLDETAARQGVVDLVVEVSSPAAYNGTVPDLSPDGRPLVPGSAPVVRATVLRTDTDAEGRRIQSIVAPEDALTGDCTPLEIVRTADGTVWSAPVSFARRPPAPGSHSSYSLYLEEVEAYAPTADPVDPVTGMDRPQAVETGPRFAAIVPLTLPEMPVAPRPNGLQGPHLRQHSTQEHHRRRKA